MYVKYSHYGSIHFNPTLQIFKSASPELDLNTKILYIGRNFNHCACIPLMNKAS